MTRIRFAFTVLFAVATTFAITSNCSAQVLGTEAEQAPTAVQQAGTTEGDLGVVKQTSWPSIPLPKLTMPQITLPRLWPSEEDDRPALLSPFVAGATKISEGTKKAWEGAKEIFSVGNGKTAASSPAPAAEPKPSIWKRLIGRAPEKETANDGPKTVGEFMSQKRLTP